MKFARAVDVLPALSNNGCRWDVDGIGEMRTVLKDLGLKPGKVMKLLYAAVEGRTAGLPLFDSIELLGREVSVARLQAARARL